MNWDHIASGERGEVLLILPCRAMIGGAGFTRIPAFEDSPSLEPAVTKGVTRGQIANLRTLSDSLNPSKC